MAIVPAVRVELIVPDPSADYLTLNDPVRGELDEALYPLYDADATTTVDLTAGSFSYAVRRGRSSELDDVSTGTLSVMFRNYDGLFDPATITPGRRVRLYLDEVTVYDGRIVDWLLGYESDGSATAQLDAVDALGILAEGSLAEWTTTAQTSDVRFEAVLDRPEIGFPATRSVGSNDGESGDIGADVVPAGTNALTYIRKVTYSDLGYVYASRLGLLTFEPRRSISTTIQASFSDDGTAIPFASIRPSSSARYLYNRVSVTRVDGVEQIAQDAASQATYGVRTLTLSDMLMNADDDAANLAGALLSFYSAPATRIESLSVNLGGLTDSQRAQVLALELGDFVAVAWTPRGGSLWEMALRIEGIDCSGAFNGSGAVDLSLSPADYFPVSFVLDDATHGVLDTSRLYF